MSVRADILAGRAVILVNIQDTIDKQLRTIRSKMRVFSNSLSEIGGDLFRGGVAGTFAAFFPVKQFVDFQDSILFLQSKLRNTKVDIVELEAYIRKLGRTTSFTSKQVAETAAVLAQAGLDEKLRPAILPTLDLARSERVEPDVAGRILANVLSSYDIAAEKAQETASKLATAARLGTTDLILLGESLKYNVTTFRQLNIPLEDALGMITMLSNAGMRGSLAGTSLNTAFGELVTKTKELAKIGVFLTEEDIAQPLSVLIKLKAALGELSAPEQQETLRKLFNIRGARGIGGQTIQDLKTLDDITKEIRNSTDEARQGAILMDSRLGGVFRRASSALEEFSISLGQTTEGPLTTFGTSIQRLFDSLAVLTQQNSRLGQAILFTPPAVLATSAAFLLLSTTISKVIMLFSPLLGVNKMFFTSLAAIVGVNVKAAKSTIDKLRFSLIDLQKTSAAKFKIPFLASLSKMDTGFTREFPSFLAGLQRPLLALIALFTRLQDAVDNLTGRGMSRALSIIPAARTAYRFQRPTTATDSPRPGFSSGRGLMVPDLDIAGRSLSTAFWVDWSREYPRIMDNTGRDLSNAFWVEFSRQYPRITQDAGKGLAVAFGSELPKTIDGTYRQTGPEFGDMRPDAVGGTGLDDIVKGMLRAAAAPFRAIFSAIKTGAVGLKNVVSAGLRLDWIKGAYITFTKIGSAIKFISSGLLRIASIPFRLSGLIAIGEFLFLFGDKIPVVREALGSLGTAFAGAFANIGQTIKDTGAGFSEVFGGLTEIFNGQIDPGLRSISFGFNMVGESIREGLAKTWRDFLTEIEPGATMIRNAIVGVIAVFNQLLSVIGTLFGTAVGGAGLAITADKSLVETMQSMFSPENFQAFFAHIVGFIESIGSSLVSVIGMAASALAALGRGFAAMLRYLPGTEDSVAALDPQTATRNELLDEQDSIRAAIQGITRSGGQITPELAGRLQEIETQLATMPDPLIAFLDDAQKKIKEAADKARGTIGTMTESIVPMNDLEKEFGRITTEGLPSPSLPDDITQGITDEFTDIGFADKMDPLLNLGPEFGNLLGNLEEYNKLFPQLDESAMKPDLNPEWLKRVAQIQGTGQIIKSIVGGYEQSRAQRMQLQVNKLDEERNELLQGIKDGIENQEPAVFGP